MDYYDTAGSLPDDFPKEKGALNSDEVDKIHGRLLNLGMLSLDLFGGLLINAPEPLFQGEATKTSISPSIEG